MFRTLAIALFVFINSFSSAFSGDAAIVDAKATKTGNGVYSFSVTVKHGDEGWKHYVNKWDVLSLDGKMLGSRTLWHPHVNEQPFTRSLGGVSIASDITKVKIRVHDSVHGYSKKEFEVDLPK